MLLYLEFLSILGYLSQIQQIKHPLFYKNSATLLDKVVTQAIQAKTLSVAYDPHAEWFDNNGVQILGDKNQFATIEAYLLALNAL